MNRHDRAYLHPRLGHMAQLASIRKLLGDDGKGRGQRVLEVDNGSGLAFTVYPDRGMDIGRASFRGVPLAWLSRNPEVAPQFYDAEGLEWLRTWEGGLLTGCGLTNVGGPGTANNERYGLHGRLSHTPAEEVNTSAGWSASGAYALSASGRVCQGRVFGENLVLCRTLSTALGDNAITVRDAVTNRGFEPAPFMLLYHINLGWPLVDESASLVAPPHRVEPQNEHAAAGLANWSSLSAPVPGFREQVYYHTLPAEADGLASLRLENPKLGLAFTVTYRTAELPYLIQWKMMGQGEYVLGLEPANCLPEGQEQNARKGLLRHLAPGETVEAYLRLSVAQLDR